MSRLAGIFDYLIGRVDNIGLIIIGVITAQVSYFIRTDMFEAILDVVGFACIFGGLAITVAGIYRIGDALGWWNNLKSADRSEPPVRLIGSPVLFL